MSFSHINKSIHPILLLHLPLISRIVPTAHPWPKRSHWDNPWAQRGPSRARGVSWLEFSPLPTPPPPLFPVRSLFRSRAGEGGPESPPPRCSWRQGPVAMELGSPLAAGQPISESLARASLVPSGRAVMGGGWWVLPPKRAEGNVGVLGESWRGLGWEGW